MGGISFWQLTIVLLLILLLFGSGKLSRLGSELGEALKSFRRNISDDNDASNEKESDKSQNLIKENKDSSQVK